MENNIYQTITDQLIASLAAGTRPWRKSWVGSESGLPLRHNGQPYQGVNVLILGMTPFSNPYWMTYKQAQEYGGQVIKGARSTKVVFFKALTVEDKTTGDEKNIPMLRTYSVFNAEQIDGLPDRFYPAPVSINVDERDAAAEKFFRDLAFDTRHGGDRAYYIPSQDFIQMPTFESFENGEAYYATRAHEAVHMTGHESRLDRDIKNANGTRDYAREELVAEIGAAYLCNALGVSDEPRADHADYLASWLSVLKEDNRAIFRAASAAQKAVDFIHNETSQNNVNIAA